MPSWPAGRRGCSIGFCEEVQMKKKPAKKAPKKPAKPKWTTDELCEAFLKALGYKPHNVQSVKMLKFTDFGGVSTWSCRVTTKHSDD